MSSPYRTCSVERQQGDCDHGLTFPADEHSARDLLRSGLTSHQIREMHPRLFGLCPKGCGYNGIAYVSLAHYVAGDW